jgi:AraC family transcriptional regulator of adaptative response/methylated-DNA-[protein]-cysteine methyltransferase
MTPRQYRSGGASIHLSYVTAATPIGPMLLAATDRGICFLQFAETDDALLHLLRQEFPKAHLHQAVAHDDLHQWIAAIHDYLSGAALPADLPLDIRATAFQMRVWDYLQTIPAGQSRSYSQAAADLGQPAATRAVASACARNRVALLIPCHRVLRSNGDMAGYRWGVERKKALLALEQRHPAE